MKNDTCVCGRRAVRWTTGLAGQRIKVCHTCRHEIEETRQILDRIASTLSGERLSYLTAVANGAVA